MFAQAVRREGAALLAGVRARASSASPGARPSTGCRWCRSAATCACWARIRASRSRPSTARARWPPSRSGSATRSWSRARCSTCCCRSSSTSSTTRASATLLPPTIGTVLPELPAATAGLLPGDKRRERRRPARPLLGRAGATSISDVGRQDAALRDPPRPRRRGARRHADRDRALGPAAAARSGSAGSACRRAFTCPRSACWIRRRRRRRRGSRRSTSSPPSTAFRSRPGPSSRARSSAPGPRRCGSTTCAAATRRCRSRTSRSRSRARRSSSRWRCSTPPGGATTRPGSCRRSCSSSRSSRGARPTGSACAAAIEIQTLDGAPLAALGRAARAAGRPPDNGPSASAGSRRAACSTRRPSGRRSGRELDVYRQEEQRLVFGALNRLAWKTEVRRCRSPTGSATRSRTRSSAPARSSRRWSTASARSSAATCR